VGWNSTVRDQRHAGSIELSLDLSAYRDARGALPVDQLPFEARVRFPVISDGVSLPPPRLMNLRLGLQRYTLYRTDDGNVSLQLANMLLLRMGPLGQFSGFEPLQLRISQVFPVTADGGIAFVIRGRLSGGAGVVETTSAPLIDGLIDDSDAAPASGAFVTSPVAFVGLNVGIGVQLLQDLTAGIIYTLDYVGIPTGSVEIVRHTWGLEAAYAATDWLSFIGMARLNSFYFLAQSPSGESTAQVLPGWNFRFATEITWDPIR
jgi:hypothetical protein